MVGPACDRGTTEVSREPSKPRGDIIVIEDKTGPCPPLGHYVSLRGMSVTTRWYHRNWKQRKDVSALEILPKRQEQLDTNSNIPSTIVAILVLPITEIMQTTHPPHPRQDDVLDLIVIIAL